MNKTINYAYSELKKYYNLVTGSGDCKIKLNLQENSGRDLFEDKYSISITGGKGEITGINPRSILLAVYHTFRAVGVRFIRPGENGEELISIKESEFNVNLDFKPGYRHRGITIEGSNSLENILRLIEFAPKAGFNSYFIQFRNSYEFFERWYKHKLNSVLKPVDFCCADAEGFIKVIIEELKLRGMVYHAVGHGWTCECLGVPSTGWHRNKDGIPDSIKDNLALINGVRKYYKDIPLNTHLCYSKEAVRKRLADEAVDYIKKHREIDVLHFWLADDFNNVCECDGCKNTRLADFYISILNDIDSQLTRLNIGTKICFLVYLELYWTPEKNKIINQDRFIMMFAPIFRTYTKPYIENGKIPDKKDCEILTYELNNVKYPSDVKTYLAFLYRWKEEFKGDSFDFDYHLMWDIYRDLSGMTLSRVLYDDIISLDKIGLNGLMSCQVQRAFFPNALPMYVMSQALFDKGRTYEEIEEEFFNSAYGINSAFAKEFFYKISELVSFKYFRKELPENDIDCLNNFAAAIIYLDKTTGKINNLGNEKLLSGNQKESLKQLGIFAKYLSQLLPIVIKKANSCKREEIINDFEALKNRFDVYETELCNVVDMFYLNLIIGGFIEEHFEEKLYV